MTDIEDDILLGADILMQDECGPSDIMLSSGIINFGGETIPVQKIGSVHRAQREMAADHYVNPPPQM